MLFDPNHHESAYIFKFIENIWKTNEIETIETLRAAIICNILSLEDYNDFNISNEISKLSNESLFSLYCRLLTIIEKCNELDNLIDIKFI